MNRPIKFRAWDFENKVMHTPKIQDDQTFVLQLNCNYMGEFNGKKYEPIKMILMQFTGLHDKNGREIYEGDILHSQSWGANSRTKNPYHVVEWSNVGWVASGYNGDMKVKPSLDVRRDFEIIGNLYQTPELIQK